MSKPSNIDDDDENKMLGPDYVSFYVGEVSELFSKDDVVPLGSQTSELFLGDVNGKNAVEENHYPLFSNSLKADSKRERLKALLRQGVRVLSQEVDEMLGPVVSIQQLRFILRTRNCGTLEGPISDGNGRQSSPKKLKFSSTTSPMDGMAGICGSNVEVNEDLQSYLVHDSAKVEEIISKCADEYSETLKHMEQQLEKLLDFVTSKCRSMSPKEKQQLQKMIQKLPQENLARVVEIVQHHKLEKELSPVEVFIDLDKEDGATLWRLYYYTEAVEKAKKLAK